ncbi:TPA: HlyD family efflux transporter periplasmic adaptor subunit [Vibrio vulnificus]|nr:HlyD family efflux transporter periplasmic adaptor subunit [Vibrio vulnificus]
MSKIYAPNYFYVDEVLVSESERVSAGDALIVLKPFSESGSTADQSALVVTELENQISLLQQAKHNQVVANDLRKAKLQLRSDEISNMLELYILRIDALEERLATAEANFEKYSSLIESGHTSHEKISIYKDKLLQLKKSILDEKTEQLAQQSSLAQVSQELESTDTELQLKLHAIDVDISELKTQWIEVKGRSRLALRATTAGTVSFLDASVGEVVTPNQLLASILPLDEVLQVELIVPTRAFGFIRKGQEVTIKLDAFPFQKFGTRKAVTTDISSTVFLPAEVNLPVAFDSPSYRVTASLSHQYIEAYNETIKLRAGMQVTADILLDERSLVEWLIDPIISFYGE